MSGPFKMAGFSGFGNSPVKQTEEGEEKTLVEKTGSIAYGGIPKTIKNEELIKQQNILNDEKNANPDWSDAEFADWQNRMNAVRAQFEK